MSIADENTATDTEIEESSSQADEVAADADDESTSDNIELTGDKELQAKRSHEGRINAAKKAIEHGVKALDDYPQYIQDEINGEGSKTEEPAKADPANLKAKKKDALLFERLEKTFKALPKSQQALVKEKFDDISTDEDFLDGEALEEALKFASVTDSEEKRKALGKNASIDSAGASPDSDDDSMENYSSLDKRIKMLRELVG